MVRHPQPNHRLAALDAATPALLLGEIPVEVVIAQLRVAAGGFVTSLNLLGGGKCLIDLTCVDKLLEDVTVDVLALRLAVGRVRPPTRRPRPSRCPARSARR